MAPLHDELHQMDMAGRPFSPNGFNTTEADLHLFSCTRVCLCDLRIVGFTGEQYKHAV
jgi:hypothetical protein